MNSSSLSNCLNTLGERIRVELKGTTRRKKRINWSSDNFYKHVQKLSYLLAYLIGIWNYLKPIMSVSKCLNGLRSRLGIVLGAQWGDEGKGKLVDLLSTKYQISARFNGGDNAGHTVVKDGVKYAFHLVPCGIVTPGVINLLGNGCVINLEGMFN